MKTIKKLLTAILSLSMIISLFTCLSGLSAYAIDNTPEPKEVVEKASEETADNKAAETPKKVEETEKTTFSATSPIKRKSTTAEAKNATSGTCGKNVTWEYNTSTDTLTISGTGAMSSYSSSSYDGNYVTTAPWREYCNKMKTLVINTGVTSIGSNAFRGCTGLTSITICNSVTSIGEYAFRNCTGIKGITIPDSVTSIGSSVFYGCKGLTSITIPDSVTSIGNYAFAYCTKLTSITIPDSVTSIGENAFACCTGLKSVTIGNGVTSIGNYAFRDCTGLTSITIPDSVTSIGNSAFYGCTSLTSITIPDSVTSMGYWSFQGYTSLTSVTIPDSITSIDGDAFYGCKSLTSITIPDSVTSIGNSAFYGCTSLTSITIPDSVTSIGWYAFNGCTGLTSITIPDSVTSIGAYAFYGCTSLTSITIPDSITSIDGDAFHGCKSLTSITIPDSITSIGSYAFSGCTGLTSITIPDSVTSIGRSAFSGCTSLTSITIPRSVTSIYYGTFYGCTGLTSITIPDSVTYIGDYAFNGCTGLTSITIPDSVTSIVDYTFSGCTGLKSITIGNGVTSIGSGAFEHCTGLESIVVANSNKQYHSSGNCLINTESKILIAGCKSSVIPDDGSVTSIGEDAFRDSTGLTSITIPDSVTSIGRNAFSGCTGLKTVYYKGGTESDWAKISIGEGNTCLINATRVCYFDTCGENVFYNIDNNTLNIVGQGTMDNYKMQSGVPWYDQKDNITCVRTDKGVSKIGTYSFNCLGNLKNVIIQNKNADIGKYAFNTNNKNIKVFAESGGNIATYCINNGINYVDPKPQATTKSITSDTITVNAETGFEYSINGTTNWQTEGVFTGLNPATTYYIYARNKDVLDYFENTSYKPLAVKTVKRTVTAPAAPVCISNTDTKIVLKSNSLYEYSIDGIYWQKSNIFTNLTHGETYSLYQRIAETSTDYASSASEPLTMKLVKKEVSAPAAPDYNSHTENSITLKPNSKYEFSMDGKNWQKSNVFTNLSKNTIYRFYQRVAETDTEYVSTSSPTLITAIPDKPQVTGTTGESITIKQIEGFEYCLDDMVWQKSNVFDMLIEDMEYYVYQRIAAIPEEVVYQITSDYTAVKTDNSISFFIPGDINGDEEITDQDAIYLLFSYYFPDKYPVDQPCDFNNDGFVTDQDAIYLLFHYYFPDKYPIE